MEQKSETRTETAVLFDRLVKRMARRRSDGPGRTLKGGANAGPYTSINIVIIVLFITYDLKVKSI